MEKRHIKHEKECDLNSYELRELDKQSRWIRKLDNFHRIVR
jgi:hypothetical protein